MESALIEPSVDQVDSGDRDVGVLYWRFRQHADRQALEALVENLQGPAFRVARLICGSDALAEEAAQEAFLAVLSPKAAPPNSSETFRAWFMKVVVNRARMARRTEYRAARKKRALQEDAAKAGAGEHDGTSHGSRSAECQALLRCLDELEERWRTPLALYYMEGLPQRDVALALGVSQQCASERIRKGLALLRGRLAQAGVAALVPLGSAEALGPVLQAAVSAPASWTALIRAQAASGHLVRLAAGAAEQSRRLAAVTSFGFAPWLAAAVLALATAGIWYAASHSENTPAPFAAPGTQGALPPPDEPPEDAPSQAHGLLALWNFDQGPAEDLDVVRGTWTWQAPRKKEPGSMRSRERVWVVPPLDLPAQPVRVAVRFAVQTKEPFAWSVLRTDGQQVLPRRLWSKHDAEILPRRQFELHVYLVGPYIFELLGGARSSASLYQTDHGPICCYFMNMDIHEIEIRTLDQKDLPAFLRDPEAALRELGVEPSDTPAVPLRESE